MRTEEYYNELIRQAKNKIAEKNDIKKKYDADFAIFEQAQILVATVSTLLENNDTAVTTDLNRAMDNFESYIRDHLKDVPEAENIVGFKELRESGSVLETFKRTNKLVKEDINSLGTNVDTYQTKLAEEINSIVNDIASLENSILYYREMIRRIKGESDH